MAYRGRASNGCARCRGLKVKCDETRPSCRRCSVGGYACSGYRDRLDLMFRDQNELVVRKSHGPAQSKRRGGQTPEQNIFSPAQSVSVFNISMSPRSGVSSDPSFQPLFALQMDMQASCFFFHNYVLVNNADLNGYLDFLPSMYENSSRDSALPKVIEAIGLASLSNVQGSREMMTLSRSRYNSSLNVLTSALRDPEQAATNQTMMTIILLAMYENISLADVKSVTSWSTHINGGLALLQSRGNQILDNPDSRRIVMQLRSQILTDCLQDEEPMPEVMIEWTKYLRKTESAAERPLNAIAQIYVRLCALRAGIKHQTITDPEEITSTAFSIDNELRLWATELTSTLEYKSVTLTERHEDVYEGKYDIYPSVTTVQIWNNYRCGRLLAIEIAMRYIADNSILSFIDPTLSAMSLLHEGSQALMLSLASDICASIPYLMGFHKPKEQRGEHMRVANGYLVIWPLYVAGSMDDASDDMISWIITQVESIGRQLGIRQTVFLVALLKSKRNNLRQVKERTIDIVEDEKWIKSEG